MHFTDPCYLELAPAPDSHACWVQTGKTIELNSIACNPLRPWQFAVGGGDEYVRIYDQRRTLSAGSSSSIGHQSADMALPVCFPVALGWTSLLQQNLVPLYCRPRFESYTVPTFLEICAAQTELLLCRVCGKGLRKW